MMTSKLKSQFKKGAVSLYVVIFATLLISVITVSFMRIMLTGQRQAMNADLSQSAYDSALAGVEDAKVALLRFADACPNGADPDGSPVCAAFNGTNCDAIQIATGQGNVGEEVIVQQNETDDRSAALQQAYTCVTINPHPTDYISVAQPGESILVPLSLMEGGLASIDLSWFTRTDNNNNNNLGTANITNVNALGELFSVDRWDNRGRHTGRNPSLMRVQIIQVANNGWAASDFGRYDDQARQGTLFLYPSTAGTANAHPTPIPWLNARYPIVTIQPRTVRCLDSFSEGEEYACRARIPIPTNSGNMMTFVRITSFYHPSTFRIEPRNSDGNLLRFRDAQAVVDSNGRANNLHRRVEARVELGGSPLFPEFAVDLDGSGDGANDGRFCKDLVITNRGQNQGC